MIPGTYIKEDGPSSAKGATRTSLRDYTIEVLCEAFGTYSLVRVEANGMIVAKAMPGDPFILLPSDDARLPDETWTIYAKPDSDSEFRNGLFMRVDAPPTLRTRGIYLNSESDVAGYVSWLRTNHLRGPTRPIHPHANEGDMPFTAREAWRRYERGASDTPSQIVLPRTTPPTLILLHQPAYPGRSLAFNPPLGSILVRKDQGGRHVGYTPVEPTEAVGLRKRFEDAWRTKHEATLVPF
ncbi:MAG: hypothetical protein ACYTFG_13870 [Planctomycetota bacterium]|jgi:hypothetical protein